MRKPEFPEPTREIEMSDCCESYKEEGKFCKDCPQLKGLDKKARKKKKKKLLGKKKSSE